MGRVRLNAETDPVIVAMSSGERVTRRLFKGVASKTTVMRGLVRGLGVTATVGLTSSFHSPRQTRPASSVASASMRYAPGSTRKLPEMSQWPPAGVLAWRVKKKGRVPERE